MNDSEYRLKDADAGSRDSLRAKVGRFLMDEGQVCKLTAAMLAALAAAAYILADYYVTDNFAFDWYASEGRHVYTVLNFTYIRVLENYVLLLCSYVHR